MVLVTDTDLETITVKMYGKEYVLHPAEDLALHPSSVGEHLQEQASRFAFYATVRDMALVKVEALQGQLASVEAELSDGYRSGKYRLAKTTDEAVKLAIRGDATYVKAKGVVADAQMEYDMLNSVVKAFEHRREMLIEMSRRANNSTWNDRDVDATVAVEITPIERLKKSTQGLGQHPSKKG